MFIGLEKIREEHTGVLLPTDNERDLLLLIRHRFPFGKFEIEVRDGVPIFLNEIISKNKLG